MSAKRVSYRSLKPASPQASKAARGSSKKSGTKPELLLRRALWRLGCRYRKNVRNLSGKPDIVFPGPRVAVFCDGDFWHGKDWASRRRKLQDGHNADYWVAKIERNMERDRSHTAALEAEGWVVVRVWESDVRRDPDTIAESIAKIVRAR